MYSVYRYDGDTLVLVKAGMSFAVAYAYATAQTMLTGKAHWVAQDM